MMTMKRYKNAPQCVPGPEISYFKYATFPPKIKAVLFCSENLPVLHPCPDSIIWTIYTENPSKRKMESMFLSVYKDFMMNNATAEKVLYLQRKTDHSVCS